MSASEFELFHHGEDVVVRVAGLHGQVEGEVYMFSGTDSAPWIEVSTKSGNMVVFLGPGVTVFRATQSA